MNHWVGQPDPERGNVNDCAVDGVLRRHIPFRIRTIRTDRGHEFQALFHWHVADLGMEHVYIKPRTPQLNGKVERSHRTDKDEFYQLLTYRDDVDLEKKLAVWERFYNFTGEIILVKNVRLDS